MPLLHGVLDVWVHEAKDLSSTYRIQVVGCMKRYVCCGQLPQLSGSCDPYLCLDVGNTRRLRTRFIEGTHNPVWNERFEVNLADEADSLKVWVKDADVVGADFLGQAVIPVSEVLGGRLYDSWLELTDMTGAPLVGKDLKGERKPSRVHIAMMFRPVRADGSVAAPPSSSVLRGGVSTAQHDGATSPDLPPARYNQVPRTYFPMRPGNRVTLYHDATCTPGPVPDIRLAGGKLFSEHSCWDDIYDALMGAERLIFITGWSVWTETMLKRKPLSPDNAPTLGELLKSKAAAGVKVLLLVWDDTTNNNPVFAGVMGTHDNETHAYFRGTDVVCVLCPRQGGTEDSYLQMQVRGNTFTHHQKTVVVDAPLTPAPFHSQPQQLAPSPSMARRHNLLERAGSRLLRAGHHQHHEASPSEEAPSRRLVAFVGGLDLTEGRYDTHDHPLFDTTRPGGPHEHDTYQGCIAGLRANAPYPREPWHDIHAKVEGPVAMDVAINFMERWFKQAKTTAVREILRERIWRGVLLPQALRSLQGKVDEMKNMVRAHVPLRVMAIQQLETTLELADLGDETWNIQLFRSIDSNSAEGFPSSVEGSFGAGLTAGKGKSIDASIHRAYINLVRGAKRYLYLENQYFLGSAHLWDSDTDTPCFNQVPAEIALKIVSKIKAGEPFRVYIVIPMFPEGVPTSGSVQAILYFQAKTRQMMYRRIAAAIAEAGLTGRAHPQDYLQFFCLGKRESNDMNGGENPPVPTSHPAASPLQAADTQAQQPAAINGTPSTTAVHGAPYGVTNGTAGSTGYAIPNGVAAARVPPGTDDSVGAGGADAEVPGPTLSGATGSSPQERSTAARRFMIYVHSKLMIVDDEYIVVGSANINQRSLDGTRDSEICIGAFQPSHTLQQDPQGPLPRGEVAGFRQALWKEHLGELPAEVSDPSRVECMRLLTALGNANWAAYVEPSVNQPLPHGHLMTYPTWADAEGGVRALEGLEEFPDLGGKVTGQKSALLPPILTT